MTKRILATALLLASASTALRAQAPSHAAQARDLWKNIIGYVNEAAKELPDSLYGYRPTPEVRSFGELFAHIAGSQQMFCAMALGEKAPAEDAVEKSAKTKAEIVAALDASNTYCERAYAQSDGQLAPVVDMFGMKQPRFFALILNASHDDEHYGNVVTYMRMNKMVPPSSRPRTAQ